MRPTACQVGGWVGGWVGSGGVHNETEGSAVPTCLDARSRAAPVALLLIAVPAPHAASVCCFLCSGPA